jgi:MFS family permease
MAAAADGQRRDESETAGEDGNPSLEAWKDLRKDENAPLRVLYTMVALEVGGFAMCIPVLAFFAIKELGVSPSQLGLVMSANAASQLVGSWTCGRLSDSFGRKWLLLGSFGWSCLNIGLTAFVYSFMQLLVLRTLGGLSGGTNPLCQAYILDWVPEKKRPAFIGLFGFLCGIAFLAGNMLGMCLLLLGVERRSIFLIAAFFASLATLYGVFHIEESLEPKKQRSLWSPREAATDVDELGKVTKLHSEAKTKATSDYEVICVGLVCTWCVRFLHALAGAIMFSTYAFLIDRYFGWSDLHFGALMAIFGLLYALLQFAVYPLFGRFGKSGSAASSGLANICGILGGISLPMPVVWIHFMALFFLTFTGALFEPSVPVLVGLFAGELHLGFGNGVATACRCAASIIGPFLGGILFEKGIHLMCWTGCSFYALGVVGCIGIALSPLASHEETRPLLGKASAGA